MNSHHETHFSQRRNWLRAAVLGANDGLISTASLLMGMAAAKTDFQTLMLTGISALVAGAISMAAGEYVSVSSQSDTEHADLEKEKRELVANPIAELKELADIYVKRGLTPTLACEVAKQLSAHNALDAHARDEIGITEIAVANPLQASFSSAAAFSIGALMPVLVALMAPAHDLMLVLTITTLLGLTILGWVSAKLGGAKVLPAIARVVVWGMLALGITGLIGKLVGASL